ncbi:MAG: pyridoxamine 5'-phosphate oxidase family protein [Chloroflexi bacterium]|nr:pyridoxamine 5'-phosphate oxidase family protein [Chloroflexota bacterium]
MAKLTQDMKDLIAAQKAFVATVNADGTPNIGPKGSTKVLDDEHLIFDESTGKQTYANVQRGSRVAIAVVDRDKSKGYRFVGTSEAITSGPLYDKAAEARAKAGRSAPKCVVKIKIEKIYDLSSGKGGNLISG